MATNGRSAQFVLALLCVSACQSEGDDELQGDSMAQGNGGTVSLVDEPATSGGTAASGATAPRAGSSSTMGGADTAPGGTGSANNGGRAGAAAGGGGSTAGGSEGAGASGSSAGGAGSSGGSPMSGGAPGGEPGGAPGACLDGIQDFGKAGPFKTTTKKSGAVNFYVPSVPAGCKVPIVHLANGTGASCATYLASLQRLATHGFLAACYESPNTGAGDQGLTALDTALTTFPELVDNKFGSTGHSQGGQGAFTVLALAEKKYGDKFVYAGLAIQPASGFGSQPAGTTWQALYAAIKSPMFMFSGLGTDGLVSQSWVRQAYDATSKTQEAYFWTANGASHIPVPNGETQEISIPWFRWKLLDDQAACRAFVAIPKNNSKWAQVAAKNQVPCR
jgi:hypothetical protein